MKPAKQPEDSKARVARIREEHRKEKAQQVTWTYRFSRDEPNGCVCCGRSYQALGLEVCLGNSYCCGECLQELRPDLWKSLKDFRTRYHKPHLTDKEIAARDDFVQPLLGTGLSELYRRHVEHEKALVERR